jgi:hypothetical protein
MVSIKYTYKLSSNRDNRDLNIYLDLTTACVRAFFKKLQLLGLSLNEGLFPTQFIRVHKNHSVFRGSASAI